MPSWVPWTVLIVGTFTASVAAILIRYAEEAPALAISFWRCAGGAAVLGPFAYRRLRSWELRDLLFAFIAGAFLAVHFATWISSIERTSIAASVLLVSTGPVFIALAAPMMFRERVGRAVWAGIVIALGGTALVAGTDLGGTSLSGNMLALAGGAAGGYYVAYGQLARRQLGVLEYAFIAYAFSAVLLLMVIGPSGTELVGYASKTWIAIAALTVGPQLLGHTMINFVLSDIDATTVSVTIMTEPIIATGLAFALFDEVPSWLIYPGGAAILLGIYVASTARREPVVISE
jgi:drug/metabolite transporter (DMT)-like permease